MNNVLQLEYDKTIVKSFETKLQKNFDEGLLDKHDNADDVLKDSLTPIKNWKRKLQSVDGKIIK